MNALEGRLDSLEDSILNSQHALARKTATDLDDRSIAHAEAAATAAKKNWENHRDYIKDMETLEGEAHHKGQADGEVKGLQKLASTKMNSIAENEQTAAMESKKEENEDDNSVEKEEEAEDEDDAKLVSMDENEEKSEESTVDRNLENDNSINNEANLALDKADESLIESDEMSDDAGVSDDTESNKKDDKEKNPVSEKTEGSNNSTKSPMPDFPLALNHSKGVFEQPCPCLEDFGN